MEIRQLNRSKALEWAGYASETRTLRLQFRHGGVYDYANVPSEVFDGLATSAHPWREWQQHIKATYRCDRVDEG